MIIIDLMSVLFGMVQAPGYLQILRVIGVGGRGARGKGAIVSGV
jgi:hypothetical protein